MAAIQEAGLEDCFVTSDLDFESFAPNSPIPELATRVKTSLRWRAVRLDSSRGISSLTPLIPPQSLSVTYIDDLTGGSSEVTIDLEEASVEFELGQHYAPSSLSLIPTGVSIDRLGNVVVTFGVA